MNSFAKDTAEKQQETTPKRDVLTKTMQEVMVYARSKGHSWYPSAAVFEAANSVRTALFKLGLPYE